MHKNIAIAFLLLFVASSSLTSAVVVESVLAPTLAPGQESAVLVSIKNTLDDHVEDLSFGLILDDTQFITVGGTEDSTDELREGRSEEFSFAIKPAYDIKPGDYQLPYEMSYTLDNNRVVKKGSIGVHVGGSPELRATIEATTPVIGMKDTVTVTIVNDGLADARFVSLSVRGDGMNVLSDKEIYIGSVDSDDFETATFDVSYTKSRAALEVTINYRDLDNKRLSFEERLPLTVYTRDEAVSRGIVTESKTLYYVGILILIIILWFIWRMVRKRRRARLSAAH